ncbi:putative NBD/HSP70 family sugar kinase [Chthoniobacter flavus]|nr:putative NBD/HSP70 family sugar kinase [Chthoniobacter flavus]
MHTFMHIRPSVTPPLDPGFIPAELWNRAYLAQCEKDPASRALAIALERTDGTISRFDTRVLPHTGTNVALNQQYVERLVKFLLWARGGYRVMIGGDAAIGEMIREIYSAAGERKFDHEFMGARIYGRPMVVDVMEFDAVPVAHEASMPLGRHLEGCRIGFDLGGSDRKCAAVIDGRVVFSEEITWDPYFESDPQYHYDGINDTLRRAAAHLPRVDAIGGSAAGVYVNNEVRVASLFRGVKPVDFDRRIRRIFFELQKAWDGVPFEVVNDGEVTALAGSMSIGENAVLGVSMGTSVAGGYVNGDGSITPWLNELAFVPVDYRENAPVDEWSGDRGCAVQYFCQQGVARLAPLAGLKLPPGMKFAEQLVEVQRLMAAGDERARQIYETIGVCFGYTIAHYANFYDIRNLLILGRVTSGQGGTVIIEKAEEVLRVEFPELAGKIQLRTPNEQDKRHGQAVAAASLPALPVGAGNGNGHR